MIRRLGACFVLVLLVWVAAPADAAPTRRGWDYTFHVDDKLQRMRVRMCVRGYIPKTLTLDKPEATDAIRFLPQQPGGARVERTSDGRGWTVQGLRDGGCLEYVADLRMLAKSRHASYRGRDVILTPGAVFVRPTRWAANLHVTGRFQLPVGYRPAVPWPPLGDGSYAIDALAFKLLGEVAIGRFPRNELRLAGTVVDIAVFEGQTRATPAGIRAWIAAAVQSVADLHGRFPCPHLLVLVRPTPSRGEPVVFGFSMRAGGGHARLHLSSFARDEELPGEWVAIHEFTHLGVPWTYDAEAWFQEGFVTYYQEVLRGRAGFHDERTAWQKMEEGMQRGRRRGGDRPLESESRTMHQQHNYRRIYWAGAAIAFLIDVELRKRSGGRQSLDDVMRLLHARYGTASRPQSGLDLLRAADRAFGQAIAVPIAERHLASRAFPDLRGTYQALGIRVAGGRVTLDDSAPLAGIRKAIMRKGGR